VYLAETAAKVQAMLPAHVTVSALLDLAVGRLMAAHATNPDAANEALEAAEARAAGAMNLTIPKPLLLAMLDSTARSVGQIGGSGMVLLSAEADSLAVTTADGTTEAQATSGRATITRDGRAMVDHRLISQAVKSLPDGSVSLVMDGRGKGLVVNATGGARFKLLSADPADFPPSMQARIEAGSVASSFTGPDFALTVGRTIYAVSRDDNRYGLNGVHMEATTDDGGDLCRLVATDGSRLAWAEMEVATGAVSVQPRRLAPVAFLGGRGCRLPGRCYRCPLAG
jgi:hypothetical protein